MTDEELVALSRNGNDDATNALFAKYKNEVSKVARSFFLMGGYIDDLIQEGMIGLYNAIRSYSQDKNASFHTYAHVCIKHQIMNAIRIASSNKNKVLNSAISLSETYDGDDEEGVDMQLVLPSSLAEPDEKLISKENLAEIKEKIKQNLSPLELKVLKLYLKGYNYDQISKLGGINKKSIDNALMRIKKKLAFLKNDVLS